jgi:hypothetical protein
VQAILVLPTPPLPEKKMNWLFIVIVAPKGVKRDA